MTEATAKQRPRLRKFHVGTGQSDQEIIDQFVVRQSELATVRDVLDGNIGSDSCQHLLVVAPRGRGKTTLLVRVIAELRTNPHFSDRLLPVRLMEESQEIFTLADFWLECLYYLAKSCTPIDQALADELRASHAALTQGWTDPALEGRARATVLDAADRLGRRLVIMIENLQALCHDAEPNFGWDLRQVLQTEPQIMLLASATSRFAALEDAEAPFFELFRTLCLPPLNTEECRRLWEAISGEVVDAHRIRPLRILTGGSPRLMVVLAGFSRNRSLRQLMDHLVELIDDHTEYFRGHIEDLAGHERRVYLALIDLWQASTSAEIAARARMEIRKVSAFLGRLVERGAVVAEGTGRNRTYYAAERLYSIYYKLRRDRDEAAVVRNLIHFMVTYYQGDELAALSRQLMSEARESDGIREGLARAANEAPELRTLLEGQGMALTGVSEERAGDESSEALSEIRRHFETGQFEMVIQLADSLIAVDPNRPITDPVTEASALMWRGRAQDRFGDSAAALATYDRVVARFGESTDPELEVWVAIALYIKGVTQGRLGESAAAIATWDLVVERFGESTDRELQVPVAQSLCDKGVTQGELGESAAAIATSDRVVEHFGESTDRELQVPVAWALVNKGVTQAQLGESAAAIATWDLVVERFGESTDPELQVLVAWALVTKGVRRGQLGESAGAIATWDLVVERFGEGTDLALQVQVARALVNKGIAQGRLGESAAAIETWDRVVERFGESTDAQIQAVVGDALRNAAESLCMSGDAEAAIRKADRLRDLAGRAQSPVAETQADWAEAMPRALRGETRRVEGLVRKIRSAFRPGDETMLRAFQEAVPTLVALGADPACLAAVLEEDQEVHDVLRPLVTALRLEAGEKVRAPAEMLEVAADIRAAIDEKRRQCTR
jgi:tetratricopeptide (TPR) repeat protein